jgi:hypothetical protein
MWFSTSSGRIELQLTRALAATVSHPGECSSDVAALRTVPAIRRQLDKIDPDLLRAELAEYGAWEDHELLDHDTNLSRILWLAGCNITERAP